MYVHLRHHDFITFSIYQSVHLHEAGAGLGGPHGGPRAAPHHHHGLVLLLGGGAALAGRVDSDGLPERGGLRCG